MPTTDDSHIDPRLRADGVSAGESARLSQVPSGPRPPSTIHASRAASQVQNNSVGTLEHDTLAGTPDKARYAAKLHTFRTKAPLRNECERRKIRYAKSWSMRKLTDALLENWHSLELETVSSMPSTPCPTSAPLQSSRSVNDLSPNTRRVDSVARQLFPADTTHSGSCSSSDDNLFSSPSIAPSFSSIATEDVVHFEGLDEDEDDNVADADLRFHDDDEDSDYRLLQSFSPARSAVTTASMDELLGMDDAVPDGGDDEFDDVEGDLNDPDEYAAFTKRTRVEAAGHADQNRRPGGKKTQASLVRAWDEWCASALLAGEIKDKIVDEHSLLLFIRYSALRPKRDRRRNFIPDTRLGASQIKKLFFAALRLRKLQEADDRTLAAKRSAATTIVYDAVKSRMREALKRTLSGAFSADGDPNAEDDQDIVANTFLQQITVVFRPTDEQLSRISRAFLSHRELRITVFGHLSWVCQRASGNRGDDFRSLRLAQLQPYIWLHPDKSTQVFSVLGLQNEEKAGDRGMSTSINPVYTVFVAHRDAESCPLGALAIYLHYLLDYYRLGDKMEIDWTRNRDWRQVRVLHASTPTIPYNESCMYNLYKGTLERAEVVLHSKVHLARHLLPYKQEQMGVDSNETAKMGWKRGTYFDVYAPALPKAAVLGAHGYQVTDEYNPIWRRISVPEAFLKLVCPMAKDNYHKVSTAKKAGLIGATNFWHTVHFNSIRRMVMSLRPYLFQVGAVIYQKLPTLPIFRLPAFQNAEVQEWMKVEFPVKLARLQAEAGESVNLERIQDEVLRRVLEENRTERALHHQEVEKQRRELQELRECFHRRTSFLSPSKGFSNALYHENASRSDHSAMVIDSLPHSQKVPSTPPRPSRISIEPMRVSEGSPTSAPLVHSVRMLLPPIDAFYNPNDGSSYRIFPPILRQRNLAWSDIFNQIKQPILLWELYQPRGLADFTLSSLWNSYEQGEEYNDMLCPPLKLLEQRFAHKWRAQRNGDKQKWKRYREIPQWIEEETRSRQVLPAVVLAELEALRTQPGKSTLLSLNQLVQVVEKQRKERVSRQSEEISDAGDGGLLTRTGEKRRRAKAVDARPRKNAKLAS
ncbi:hypothetical protein BDZ89DRAFT_1073960 [Hymenopellis radicata]|nr:hypothetical protein BDZ89DRAFT_1073960 [Hymenopellis radicata]